MKIKRKAVSELQILHLFHFPRLLKGRAYRSQTANRQGNVEPGNAYKHSAFFVILQLIGYRGLFWLNGIYRD